MQDQTTHDLLLELAGRVDDDLLAWARELVAVGEDAHAVELLAASLVADRAVLPETLRAAIVRAAMAARAGLDPAAALPAAGPDGGCGHRFTAAPDGDPVVAALRMLPARQLAGCWVSLARRTTPAGSAPGPLPHPVVIVMVEPGTRATDVLAYQLAVALDRAGVRASVEVLTSGGLLPGYHEAALRSAGPARIDEAAGPTFAGPTFAGPTFAGPTFAAWTLADPPEASPGGVATAAGTAAGQDPVWRDPVDRDPVDRDPFEPDPFEPDPVEPDPFEPDPFERNIAERDSTNGDPAERDPRDRDQAERDPVAPHVAAGGAHDLFGTTRPAIGDDPLPVRPRPGEDQRLGSAPSRPVEPVRSDAHLLEPRPSGVPLFEPFEPPSPEAAPSGSAPWGPQQPGRRTSESPSDVPQAGSRRVDARHAAPVGPDSPPLDSPPWQARPAASPPAPDRTTGRRRVDDPSPSPRRVAGPVDHPEGPRRPIPRPAAAVDTSPGLPVDRSVLDEPGPRSRPRPTAIGSGMSRRPPLSPISRAVPPSPVPLVRRSAPAPTPRPLAPLGEHAGAHRPAPSESTSEIVQPAQRDPEQGRLPALTGTPTFDQMLDPLSGPLREPLLAPLLDPTVREDDPRNLADTPPTAADAPAAPPGEDAWTAQWTSGSWAMSPPDLDIDPRDTAPRDTDIDEAAPAPDPHWADPDSPDDDTVGGGPLGGNPLGDHEFTGHSGRGPDPDLPAPHRAEPAERESPLADHRDAPTEIAAGDHQPPRPAPRPVPRRTARHRYADEPSGAAAPAADHPHGATPGPAPGAPLAAGPPAADTEPDASRDEHEAVDLGLRPESVARLSAADRQLLARLQAELLAGRRPRMTRQAGIAGDPATNDPRNGEAASRGSGSNGSHRPDPPELSR